MTAIRNEFIWANISFWMRNNHSTYQTLLAWLSIFFFIKIHCCVLWMILIRWIYALFPIAIWWIYCKYKKKSIKTKCISRLSTEGIRETEINRKKITQKSYVNNWKGRRNEIVSQIKREKEKKMIEETNDK